MTRLRARLALLALAALLASAGAATLIATSNHDHGGQVPEAIVIVAIGLSFIGTGLYAWERRPDNHFGALMACVGVGWLTTSLSAADPAWVVALETVIGNVYIAVLVHMLLAFPDGRVRTARGRRVVRVGYVASVVLPLLATVFSTDCDCGRGGPRNLLLLTDSATLADIGQITADVLGAGLMVWVIAVLWRDWREADAGRRHQVAPVLWTGGLVLLAFVALFAVEGVGLHGTAHDLVVVVAVIPFIALPFAFLAGLLRTSYASLATDNERLEAELRARVAELERSRTRLLDATFAERRRLERDLHDGAQQRLVALALQMSLAREAVHTDPDAAAATLDGAREELALALEELRELARGIHPAVLTDRGLDAALTGLAERSPVPVTVSADTMDRLPGAVEAAAYFVVAESLTNVAKYARPAASEASVSISRVNGHAVVEVRDDGPGGADPARGTGLRGLADRLAALDGTLAVTSPPGGGTLVHAEIPCAS